MLKDLTRKCFVKSHSPEKIQEKTIPESGFNKNRLIIPYLKLVGNMQLNFF